MTTFKAKVTQNIPANRLIGLGGINTEGDPEEGWETVYLILSKKGWIPDFVSTSDLKEGDTVSVTITDKPVWKVEASGNLPAGTLVQCDDEGKVDRKSTRLNSSHVSISYAVFCLKKYKKKIQES